MKYIDAKTIIRNCPRYWDYLLFDYAMDLYRGCNHGCIYCYARSDYYEKTDNFDCIRVKKNALNIIHDELRRKRKSGVVITGGMSDPYNVVEKDVQLIRGALELFKTLGFGACVITKSNLVMRDVDLFSDIRRKSPVTVNFSITCANDELAKKLEPYAPSTTERFKALEYLSQNGVTTGVLMDPMIPFVTDTVENVQEMVKKAKDYGASYMYMGTEVTMADGQREYFLQEANKLYPGYSARFMKRHGTQYHCPSDYAKQLRSVFDETCDKENVCHDMHFFNQQLWSKYYDPMPLFSQEITFTPD